MAFNINDTSGSSKSFDNPPVDDGLYPARLARIIELGEQEDKYGKKEKVLFAFTVPSLMMDLDGEQKQRMFFSFPLNKTSNPDGTLVKYMKALGAVDWASAIGKSCTIEITNKTKGDKTYQNITNVVRPMAGMDIAEPDCDTYIFDFENPSKEVFEKLSEYRQGQIKEALNYEGSAVEALVEGKAHKADTPADDFDDDIPF